MEKTIAFFEKMRVRYLLYAYTIVVWILALVAVIVWTDRWQRTQAELMDRVGFVFFCTLGFLVAWIVLFAKSGRWKLSLKKACIVNFIVSAIFYVVVLGLGDDAGPFAYYRDILTTFGFGTVAFGLFMVPFVVCLLESLLVGTQSS
ncbi:MAG: hypothetical protein FWD76_04565 [Firmicutes bacterium]|nr:hypothetical protein [Bacillota bacterium]